MPIIRRKIWNVWLDYFLSSNSFEMTLRDVVEIISTRCRWNSRTIHLKNILGKQTLKMKKIRFEFSPTQRLNRAELSWANTLEWVSERIGATLAAAIINLVYWWGGKANERNLSDWDRLKWVESWWKIWKIDPKLVDLSRNVLKSNLIKTQAFERIILILVWLPAVKAYLNRGWPKNKVTMA